MVDQCIICLDTLDTSPAKLDSTNAEPASKSPNIGPAISGNDPCDTCKDRLVAVLNTCGHTLHNSCLQAWIEKANSCPICRQAFNNVEVYNTLGGSLLSTYTVENKKQVADFDPTEWADYDEAQSDPCRICGSADYEDRLLLCDGCDVAYHTYCVNLDHVPIGDWYCIDCTTPFVAATPYPVAARAPAAIRTPDSLPRASSVRSPVRSSRTWAERTRAQVRRARNQAAADNWAGAWNQISGRVWDALELDLDYSDEDEALASYRSHQRRREREKREFDQWQQRLSIAGRQGAGQRFVAVARPILDAKEQPEPPKQRAVEEKSPKQRADEEKAWEAFEKTRESDAGGSGSRKRKASSITRSPVEQSLEPERKLKRPKTRRVVNTPSSSSHMGFRHGQIDNTHTTASTSLQASAEPLQESTNAPSFLSSLLKEVEMSTSTDDESAHLLHKITPSTLSVGHSSPAVSPSTSNYSTPRAMSITPPPHRANRPGSPLPLTSRVEPTYDYKTGRPPLENRNQLDSEMQGPASSSADVMRQPRPRRVISRLERLTSSRADISIEEKERINTIVRNALRSYYKKPAGITREQYVAINRYVSHQLYDRARALHENDTLAWEEIAAEKVAKAVERHLALK